MNPTVYIETTVISYLTSRPRPDVILAGHQASTRAWWKEAPNRFDLVASQLVVRECAAGDEQAARERLTALVSLTLLPITEDVEQLASLLISGRAVPESSPEDALHIAVASAHGIQYLATWNLRHIANATVRAAIERVCRSAGYEPPVICTPEELMDS